MNALIAEVAKNTLHTELQPSSTSDGMKLSLPKGGGIKGVPSRKQRSPYESMPHLMSWVVGSACLVLLGVALAMTVLAFNKIGGQYPYIILGIETVACFILMLTFFGRHGVVQAFGSKAETQ